MPSPEIKEAVLAALIRRFPTLSEDRLRPLIQGRIPHNWGDNRPQEMAADYVLKAIEEAELDKIVLPRTAPERLEDAVAAYFVKLLKDKTDEIGDKILGNDDED